MGRYTKWKLSGNFFQMGSGKDFFCWMVVLEGRQIKEDAMTLVHLVHQENCRTFPNLMKEYLTKSISINF